MYSDRELTALAAGKAALRQRIARQRAECAEAAARVLEPVALLDQVVTRWRQLSPLVKIVALPLGLLLQRKLAPRSRVLGSLLRWGPLVLGAARSLTSRRRSDRV